MDNTKTGDLGNKRTLVEEGTQFKGSLSSSCPIVVKGRIDGDVSAPSLQVGTTGTVHGKVKVGALESHGEVSGELDADVVQLSGVVKDKTVVRAKSLEVKLSPAHGKMQVVFGECELEVGEMPSKDDALNATKEPDGAPGRAPFIAIETANGKNGAGASDAPKDVLPGLRAEALGDHATEEARKAKSAPPKRSS
jgi:cytoskeletal protein CcmA (bactofilin family)